METTTQQKNILQAVQQHKNIKINAFAGTGKTSTLKLIANEYKTKKILYLAFNTSIKNEASSIFPNNTNVKTTHGLAYAAIKKNTDIDLNSLVNYRAVDISKEFNITYNQAVGTLKIFENFCNSAKESITKEDIEHTTAKKMFDLMLVNKLKPTHGFYLKYYHLLLRNEQIKQFEYDIAMLDEAQDTNEVTLGIFEALKAKTKIYVGDEHQQIYSFRGSKNALNKIRSDKKLYLSKSFRFNETIASYANKLLSTFKNEEVSIETLDNIDDIIETHGYISRTNATLISTIAQRIESRKPFVTVRDPNEIFNLTVEVYHFLNDDKQQIKRNRFLKDFSDEDDLAEYAKEVEDYELKSALKVAKEHKEKVFEYKEIADKFYKAWQNRTHNGFALRVGEILFLTTAHTAKGLEWDSVTVADDFTDFADLIVDFGCDDLKQFQEDQNMMPNQEILDEFNLFYVAITRAKKKINKESENFHYLMSKNVEKLINSRIKEAKEDKQNITQKNTSKTKVSKLELEDKQQIRQNRNIQEGKALNSGLKWSLEDKIKAKKMFKKNDTLTTIAIKLQRTEGAIIGELLKSEVISSGEQKRLNQLLKENKNMCKKSSLSA
ncbi:MAG: AAA family ATPase [Campylobacterota bacterium]|nr:AAA family ATPase [Campylobacterota bacterium]